MIGLFRILVVVFLIWIVCYFFYSLGKRNQKFQNRRRRSKVVDCSVVEKDDSDNIH